jgi:hypothetical protein
MIKKFSLQFSCTLNVIICINNGMEEGAREREREGEKVRVEC